MSILIKRKTGWIGMAAGIKLAVNGENITKIRFDQEKSLVIPGKSARLRVKGFGYKSNEIEVKDGDVVEIRTPIWSRLLVLLTIFLMPLFQVFADSYVPTVVLLVLLLSLGFFMDEYKLRIVNKF